MGYTGRARVISSGGGGASRIALACVGCFALLVFGLPRGRAEAGIADSPLPRFSDGKASVMVLGVPGVVKRGRLQTDFVCTVLDSAPVDVGVELFAPDGSRLNDLSTGVGAVLNVSSGQTVTIGTSGTAALLESGIIPLVGIAQGSARVVASAAAVRCSVVVVDDAVTPPVSVGELGAGVGLGTGTILPGVALPQFANGQAATHAAVFPGVVKRGQLQTEIFCTSLAATTVDLGVEIFGPDGVRVNSVAGGNGAVLNVAPGATVTFGTTGTAAFLETVVIATPGIAQGLARVVGTAGQVVCSAFVLDASVTPPTAMSRLVGVNTLGAAAPTATPTPSATATPTPEPTPLCPAMPQVGCRTAARSVFLIKQKAADKGDRVVWKWVRGEATTFGDFGTPTLNTQYALCIYGASGLFMELRVPAEENCAKKPCWKAIGPSAAPRGFRYRDRERTPDGVLRVLLKSGDAGRARILAKGSGVNLPDPMLPVPEPVQVQLINSGMTACWEAEYLGSDVVANDASQFKAKARQ